ncbi:MurR/RpiR family transcriptional regulator [Clostridium sp. Sa3CUN1]|uniref:MurR/RpiR family transcriptional regulator n=1 Tax=Clostridium gallinarum TaxID=2762246 RepID=A0ABR8Q6N1_9CLOT|nr:MurR/RpiR family transcriptional regulator [Clostridium gallinarum]MBD7916088.1 MurR/RpiR family transcriptional regulator [Clostridium gallinarum]
MLENEIINTLTKKELIAYNYIYKNIKNIKYISIREIAKQSCVSTSTILSLIKKFGFSSYNEFKYFYLNKENNLDKKMYKINEIIESIKILEEHKDDYIEEAVELIKVSDYIIFTGIGNSAGIAQYGAKILSNNGKFALYQGDPFYNSKVLKGNGLVIILSVSGETKELYRQAMGYKEANIPIICITSSINGIISKIADYHISYNLNYECNDLLDFTSQIPVVYILEKISNLLHD